MDDAVNKDGDIPMLQRPLGIIFGDDDAGDVGSKKSDANNVLKRIAYLPEPFHIPLGLHSRCKGMLNLLLDLLLESPLSHEILSEGIEVNKVKGAVIR